MAFDESLALRIRNNLEQMGVQVEEKKMFGGLSFLFRGKMTVGIVKDRLCARVIEENYPNLFGDEHVQPMDFTGKKMKDFVFLEQDGIQSDRDLRKWIERGIEHAQSKL